MIKDIKIVSVQDKDQQNWDDFVIKNYPPVGAFMASWEWGNFQRALDRKVERYLITIEKKIVGVFTLVYCHLPLGMYYGYVPRGPVISDFFDTEEKIRDLFKTIEQWVKKYLTNFVFVRLEPPISKKAGIKGKSFVFPDYYIQPRRNLAINLNQTEKEILANFHPSTRANVKKAERKGVTVEIKKDISPDDFDHFFGMARDTVARNNGKNIYPNRLYFETLVKTLPSIGAKKSDKLSFCFFYGYRENKPAAMNLILFFGDTATYLFGVAYTEQLPSKVTTYLHWYAMEESKKMGFKYYDLGGIDEKLWPSLTIFKRRFGGEEPEYIGNVDVVTRPLAYRMYNFFRKIKKRI